MEKIILKNHPSVTFVCSKRDIGEVILSGYDGGYGKSKREDDVSRLLAYRSKPNLLGGNPKLSEKTLGPDSVIEREIDEEIRRFDSKLDSFGKPFTWANDEDLEFIRKEIISGLNHYGDFLLIAEPVEGGMDTYNAINSTYVSIVPMSVVECIRDNIRNRKRISNEGYIGIHYLGQLEAAGEFSTAHATAPILNEYFGTRIPFPKEIKVTKLERNVRKYYSEYEDRFSHKDSLWRS